VKIKQPSAMTLLILLHVMVLGVTSVLLLGRKKPPAVGPEKIVVIPIEGVISGEEGALGRGLSVSGLVETLKQLREKDDVKAVVLKINSPGGSVGAVQEIHRAILKFREKGKFVVSSFGDISASGGYYIACAGDKIVSNPGTLTGSIGVIMQMPNAEGLLQKIGLSMVTIKSGEMKDSGSPFRQMNPTERQYFQQLILDAYDQFYQAVKDGRHLDDAALKPLADGRVFSGRMALQNKLVDEMGGTEEAVELAKKLAGLEGKEPKVVTQKGKTSFERLLNLIGQSPLAPLESVAPSDVRLEYRVR
jgi:protease-4